MQVTVISLSKTPLQQRNSPQVYNSKSGYYYYIATGLVAIMPNVMLSHDSHRVHYCQVIHSQLHSLESSIFTFTKLMNIVENK